MSWNVYNQVVVAKNNIFRNIYEILRRNSWRQKEWKGVALVLQIDVQMLRVAQRVDLEAVERLGCS